MKWSFSNNFFVKLSFYNSVHIQFRSTPKIALKRTALYIAKEQIIIFNLISVHIFFQNSTPPFENSVDPDQLASLF